MTTAFFLGRFQPVPHNGHVQVIQEMLAAHDHISIGIGSGQYSDTPDNPLSGEERRIILDAVLQEMGILPERYTITVIPDLHDAARYVDYLRKLVPPFDVAYTGNALMQQLYAEKGITVVSLQRYGAIRGTVIRDLIKAGDRSYEAMLPAESLRFIHEWGIRERL